MMEIILRGCRHLYMYIIPLAMSRTFTPSGTVRPAGAVLYCRPTCSGLWLLYEYRDMRNHVMATLMHQM